MRVLTPVFTLVLKPLLLLSQCANVHGAKILYTFVRSNNQSPVPVSQYFGQSFAEATDKLR